MNVRAFLGLSIGQDDWEISKDDLPEILKRLSHIIEGEISLELVKSKGGNVEFTIKSLCKFLSEHDCTEHA